MSHSILVVNQLYVDSACGLGASRAFVKPFKLEGVAAAVEELLSERLMTGSPTRMSGKKSAGTPSQDGSRP